ncbi:uncharacterized protein I303_106166 [Kwoniella dejecticola CBS 10117]|uniref:Uncharacterized protein n=1 Tax=Kwoniella dejecticola CBS 10117 TaxID=1296121 RepID=A0A1A6A1G1_9TREE|nr:uncharacterized protein I303_06184 [Kwoniella dejecticola CBS 10117]OBR83899.1 hypothetical protein I303_06184 [Kwoniella dejecticola CBS 10117]
MMFTKLLFAFVPLVLSATAQPFGIVIQGAKGLGASDENAQGQKHWEIKDEQTYPILLQEEHKSETFKATIYEGAKPTKTVDCTVGVVDIKPTASMYRWDMKDIKDTKWPGSYAHHEDNWAALCQDPESLKDA